MVCQPSVACSHALAWQYLANADVKAGISINLSRVRLNKRSTSTSLRSSPTINTRILLVNRPVAAR
jgi:hypothetical protein